MKTIKPYLQGKVLVPLLMQIALIVYVISALQLAPPVVKGLLSESSFPFFIFLIATPAAIKQLYDGIKAVQKEIGVKTEVVHQKKSIKPFLTVLVMAVFVGLFDVLGFTVLAPLYVFAFMLIFDDKPQHIVRKIIYSLIIGVLVYIMYVIAFDIRFPQIWR
ncbi:MAG: hypothetical protein PWP59_2130 [Sphaerochaeta sp.]|nr:hypothetical protein [Sphaerochaeta sp.]